MYRELNLRDIDADLEKSYQSTLDRLLDHLPMDAAIQSTITKAGNFYSGQLKILTAGQNFLAKTLSKTPQMAVSELIEQIQCQISQWHKTRFN